MQLQPTVAVGSVDLDAEKIQLMHGAWGEAIAAGFIAGEGGGVDKHSVVAGSRGMDSGRGASGAGTDNSDVCMDGIDLLRHGDYHCTGYWP